MKANNTDKDIFDCNTEAEATNWINTHLHGFTTTQKADFFTAWAVSRGDKLSAEGWAKVDAKIKAKQVAREQALKWVGAWAKATGRTGSKWASTRQSKIRQITRNILNAPTK